MQQGAADCTEANKDGVERHWVSMGGGKPLPQDCPDQQEFVVAFDGPEDRLNPQNWTSAAKCVGFLTSIPAWWANKCSQAFHGDRRLLWNLRSVLQQRHIRCGSCAGELRVRRRERSHCFGNQPLRLGIRFRTAHLGSRFRIDRAALALVHRYLRIVDLHNRLRSFQGYPDADHLPLLRRTVWSQSVMRRSCGAFGSVQ